MKQFLLVLVSAFVFYAESYSQITIKDSNNNDLTNKTATLPVSPDKVYFTITNNSNSSKTFIVEVTDFTVPDDASGISVCAGGSCMQITVVPVTVGQAISIDAGAEYGTNGEADVEYFANASTGSASITVKVYEENNESNSASFTLERSTSSVAFTDLPEYLIYPNPATNYFIVTIPDNQINSELKMLNILGKTVKTIPLSQSQTTVTAEELPSGIYFVSIIKSGKIVNTKKLILK
ncbi:MAG: T9SS type A sorting domain-containing protein [Chlorobi bacterium]|nr:T9SS type A sorting domain-containing protein [Chlorobiota bacterium]